MLSFAALASAQLPSSIFSFIKPFLFGHGHLGPITLQILESLVEPITAQIERNSYIYQEGAQLMLNGKPWTASGANVYWLGLNENVIPPAGQPFYPPFNASYPTLGRITEVMNTLQTIGARTIRSQTLGVSVGNPLSVMPALGVYNEQAFNTIGWSVFQARQHGLRIIAPLVDNYDYYHGGKFNFLRFRGIKIPSSDSSKLDPLVQQFYTNGMIVQDFKNYIEHLLTHYPLVGSHVDGSRSFIKHLAPQKLVIDGTYGINKTHLDIPTIDIFSDHYYPPDNSKLQTAIALVASVNKTYLVGEYDWTANNPQASSLQSFYNIIESRQSNPEPVVVGDLLWSLFIHDVPNCNIYVNHTDGFTLQYGNPANSAQNNTQISLIRQHFFKMKEQTVDSYLPAMPCPGPTAEYTYM
ncbi:hypothetical protein MMC30_009275 [Trapelia coarctata]|nr:hypothetical protein [Trapelia coarctata]